MKIGSSIGRDPCPFPNDITKGRGGSGTGKNTFQHGRKGTGGWKDARNQDRGGGRELFVKGLRKKRRVAPRSVRNGEERLVEQHGRGSILLKWRGIQNSEGNGPG